MRSHSNNLSDAVTGVPDPLMATASPKITLAKWISFIGGPPRTDQRLSEPLLNYSSLRVSFMDYAGDYTKLSSPLNEDIKNRLLRSGDVCAPTGIRTPVVALKGLRPSPLDDGGMS